MGHDASQLLGLKQLAGAAVNQSGYAWKTVNPGGSSRENTSGTPQFRRNALLAVTDREVALIEIGRGGLNGKLKEVLARVPRGDVASAEVSRGVLRTNLTIDFTGGGTWEFEVTPLLRHKVMQVVRALGY
jgi:hypothetical protein